MRVPGLLGAEGMFKKAFRMRLILTDDPFPKQLFNRGRLFAWDSNTVLSTRVRKLLFHYFWHTALDIKIPMTIFFFLLLLLWLPFIRGILGIKIKHKKGMQSLGKNWQWDVWCEGFYHADVDYFPLTACRKKKAFDRCLLAFCAAKTLQIHC